ncbi:MAG: hypothetical protein D6719_03070 [Candidatus Dadabacteria bacterium]|nr:MAG: hypothetical protein D6719_03070 [Candidatus Dadabacteria bacterium]
MSKISRSKIATVLFVASFYCASVHAQSTPEEICQIGNETQEVPDCDGNGLNDECEIEFGLASDCNFNRVIDSCDIEQWEGQTASFNDDDDDDAGRVISLDQNSNGILDQCEDCNGNSIPDLCDLNTTDIDQFVLWELYSFDSPFPNTCREYCTDQLLGDDDDDFACDSGTCGVQLCNQSTDLNGNQRPDECESDCNANKVPDDFDISQGTSGDCNNNGRPDECDIQSPMVGTGLYNLSGGGIGITGVGAQGGFPLFPFLGGEDMFYLVFPNADSAGIYYVGPVGSSTGIVDDIAVDPSNSGLYTVEVPFLGNFKIGSEGIISDDDDDSLVCGDDPLNQHIYSVNPLTGAGTPLANSVQSGAGDAQFCPTFLGLVFNTDGSTFYGIGGGMGTLDKVGGALSQLFNVEVFGIGMARSPSGDILSLFPGILSLFASGADAVQGEIFDEQPCIAGIINRHDPITGEVLDSKAVLDPDNTWNPQDYFSMFNCRTLTDIAFHQDGTFYGVTGSGFLGLIPAGLSGSATQEQVTGLFHETFRRKKQLVRLEEFVDQSGDDDDDDLAGPLFHDSPIGYSITAVQDMTVQPLGLGGNIPAFSTDNDGDGVPDECCSGVDITETQVELDGSSLQQDRLNRRALKTLSRLARKAGKSIGRFKKKIKKESRELYLQNWTHTWSIPSVQSQCQGAVNCVSVSNAGVVAAASDNARALRGLLSKIVRKMRRMGGRKKLRKRFEKRGDELMNGALNAAGLIPDSFSQCG